MLKNITGQNNISQGIINLSRPYIVITYSIKSTLHKISRSQINKFDEAFDRFRLFSCEQMRIDGIKI